MISIMKNICKILFKRKSFILTTFILPIALIYLLAGLNNSANVFKVAVMNKDEGKFGKIVADRIDEIEGVEVVNIDEGENYKQKVSFHRYEMALIIDKDFTKKIINREDPEIKQTVITDSEYKAIIENAVETEVNSLVKISNNIEVNDSNIDKVIKDYKDSKPDYNYTNRVKKTSILSSFGVILYMLMISASICCNFILEDEREGTKDRVLMANVSERSYFFAQCTVYFLLSMIPAIEYYIICKISDFSFGFEHSYLLLIILFAAVLLAVVFSIFLASIIKKKEVYSLIGPTCSVPLFMLGGAFWDFELMGSTLQKIGNILPTRWIMLSVEKLQQGESFINILPLLGAILLLSVFFFGLSIFFTRNKIVLVKAK